MYYLLGTMQYLAIERLMYEFNRYKMLPQQRRPLRSKHCAELNYCISKFDHYCPFVGNAVGEKNHNYFLGFLFFAVATIGMVLFALFSGTQRFCITYLLCSTYILTFNYSVCWTWHFHPLKQFNTVQSILHLQYLSSRILWRSSCFHPHLLDWLSLLLSSIFGSNGLHNKRIHHIWS